MLRLWSALAPVTVCAVLLAGCGSSNSSTSSSNTSVTTSATSGGTATTSTAAGTKPAYCTSLSSLEQSLKALKGVNVVKNGTSALQSAVSQVQTNATAVVNDAKREFAKETADLKTSVDTLGASVKAFASPPTSSQVKALPAQVSAVAMATKNLATSTSPKCG